MLVTIEQAAEILREVALQTEMINEVEAQSPMTDDEKRQAHAIVLGVLEHAVAMQLVSPRLFVDLRQLSTHA